ncbi:MAG: helix-turn-helix transcriptional regulator [Oscillospiraceae bacterium]|jgi:transcriptional regulator with XRE-family HTH domain|nr:helix-turn-helix transcriptional regulator [Oscillospiraceae bacterium]
MSTDFSRVLSLLRQEKGVSQRKAAAALNISQALLSHYENGIREPGLAFVAKACDYYHVSADYLLGRSLSRDGAMIEAGEVPDASEAKEDLKGSILAKLQKKLVINTASVFFDLLGQVGSKEAISQAGAYLSAALYQLFRPFYRAAGGNESYFSTGRTSFDLDVLSAEMTLSRIQYVKALEAYRGSFPSVDSQSLAEDYQGFSQSMAQVFHNADERVRLLEAMEEQINSEVTK